MTLFSHDSPQGGRRISPDDYDVWPKFFIENSYCETKSENNTVLTQRITQNATDKNVSVVLQYFSGKQILTPQDQPEREIVQEWSPDLPWWKKSEIFDCKPTRVKVSESELITDENREITYEDEK